MTTLTYPEQQKELRLSPYVGSPNKVSADAGMRAENSLEARSRNCVPERRPRDALVSNSAQRQLNSILPNFPQALSIH